MQIGSPHLAPSFDCDDPMPRPGRPARRTAFAIWRAIIKTALLILPAGLYASATEKSSTDRKPVSVMTFNLLYDSRRNTKSIELIRRHDPDILCLTELTPDFARQFNRRLHKRYRYQALYPKKGTWGVGLLSRYPLSNPTVFPIRPHRIPGASATITIGKRTLKAVCVHLFPPIAKRKKSDGLFTTLLKNKRLRKNQAQYLVSRFRTWKNPILLMGDMNEERGQDAMAVFSKNGYRHACHQATDRHCGATYPGATIPFPALAELDHILGKNVTFTKAQVIKGGGSDHYPVKAVFYFTQH